MIFPLTGGTPMLTELNTEYDHTSTLKAKGEMDPIKPSFPVATCIHRLCMCVTGHWTKRTITVN